MRSLARMHRFRNCGGVSVLDSLATLTVLAIVGTMVAPLAGRYVSALRLRSAAWSLASDLQRARQRAIVENRSQRLTLSTTDVDPSNGSPRAYEIAPVATGNPAETREIPSGVRCTTPPGSYVEFNSRGLAAGAVVVTLEDSFGRRTDVRVRSTGRIDFPT